MHTKFSLGRRGWVGGFKGIILNRCEYVIRTELVEEGTDFCDGIDDS
jgi:hypothetical protein